MPCRTFIAREEKSGPGFKGQAGSCKGLMQLVTLKLKLVLLHHSENPRALRNYAKSSFPVLFKLKNKA